MNDIKFAYYFVSVRLSLLKNKKALKKFELNDFESFHKMSLTESSLW